MAMPLEKRTDCEIEKVAYFGFPALGVTLKVSEGGALVEIVESRQF